MVANHTTVDALAKGRKLTRPPAGKGGPTPLEQSEAQRQRALGAQAELRTELDSTKAALDEAKQRAAVESNRLEVANRVAAKAERDLLAMQKELDAARGMSANYQQDVARLGGMLDMLRELGAIPKREQGPGDMYSVRPDWQSKM